MINKKIFLIGIFLGIVILNSEVYAKYIYNFEKEIIVLKRESQELDCQVSYSTEEVTNENVIITLTCDREVEQVSGFVFADDRKTLTKEVSENISDKVIVRDLSGNYTEVEYNVDNIDKEKPQIIGCEDGEEYDGPLELDYLDNQEIKEISVDKYGEDLIITNYNNYIDSSEYRGIDRTDKSITVHICEHPLNTKKYRYYINDKLYSTIANTSYTYTGLENGKKYIIKVEALDENGDILDTSILNVNTSYFSSITSTKKDGMFKAKINNIDSNVNNIAYAVWNANDIDNIQWNSAEIKDGATEVSCKQIESMYYPLYVIHAYMYDLTGNVLDIIEFDVDFGTNYEKNKAENDVKQITESR